MNKPISYKAAVNCHQLTDFSNPVKQDQERRQNKMATLKEEALAYQPPQTLNIADLDKIPIDIELKDGNGTNKKGEDFTYKYAVVNGEEYRVAGTIIGGIKALLGKMPNLKYVSVIRQGTGMNTTYQVIPFMEQTEEKVE